jgi:hypothetical protein
MLLLALMDALSGGTLWGQTLRYVSVGLLTPENVWGLATTVGVGVGLGLGMLLEPLGELLELATDRLMRRHGPPKAFEWLEVHEEHTAEFAEKRRTAHRLFNSLALVFVAGAWDAARTGHPAVVAVGLIALALAATAIGAFTKSRWLRQTERLRALAEQPPPAKKGQSTISNSYSDPCF